MSRLLTVTGSLIDRIKINTLRREVRDGRVIWIKQRRATAGPILALANGFFRAVGNPVRTLQNVAAWQQWEVDCFRQFHGDQFQASPEEPQAVVVDELPGTSLSWHLTQGTLTAAMLAAAGRELRRAHQWSCARLGGAWSHGDPHTGNFLYDAAAGRARLIDFEVMHLSSLPANERHADDLLVFLQDLVGRVSAEHWVAHARSFLEAYGRPEIITLLKAKLIVPRGLARLWWSVRTTYLSGRQLAGRIAELRATLS